MGFCEAEVVNQTNDADTPDACAIPKHRWVVCLLVAALCAAMLALVGRR